MIVCRALEGSVVCSTGIDPSEKQELQRKVAQLLGEFKGDLASDVTHLVAQEVPSAASHSQRAHPTLPLLPIGARCAGWLSQVPRRG